MTAPPRSVRQWWAHPWLSLGAVIVVGDIGLLVLANPPARAALSFALAAISGGAIFSVGAWAVRVAGQISPVAAMIAALINYALTVLLLAFAYAASSPRVVDRAAVAAGLICAVVVWVTESLRAHSYRVNES